MSFDDSDSASDYVPGMPTDREIGDRIKSVREDRGLTQQQFASVLGGVTRGAVGNWERGQGIKRENLELVARKFEVSFEWLASGRGAMAFPSIPTSVEPVNAQIAGKVSGGGVAIPLYGQAVGGVDGEFVLNDGTRLADIVAPPVLAGIEGAYAVSVSGESMEPRYFDGEVVFVHPKRRAVRGDFVVAQIHNPNEGPPLAYVKRLVRFNEGGLVLEQFNPTKELRFEYRAVISVHVIVMGGEKLLERW
jgi:phage repressor protein C with HTH and peptisase S24 domain